MPFYHPVPLVEENFRQSSAKKGPMTDEQREEMFLGDYIENCRKMKKNEAIKSQRKKDLSNKMKHMFANNTKWNSPRFDANQSNLSAYSESVTGTDRQNRGSVNRFVVKTVNTSNLPKFYK